MKKILLVTLLLISIPLYTHGINVKGTSITKAPIEKQKFKNYILAKKSFTDSNSKSNTYIKMIDSFIEKNLNDTVRMYDIVERIDKFFDVTKNKKSYSKERVIFKYLKARIQYALVVEKSFEKPTGSILKMNKKEYEKFLQSPNFELLDSISRNSTNKELYETFLLIYGVKTNNSLLDDKQIIDIIENYLNKENIEDHILFFQNTWLGFDQYNNVLNRRSILEFWIFFRFQEQLNNAPYSNEFLNNKITTDIRTFTSTVEIRLVEKRINFEEIVSPTWKKSYTSSIGTIYYGNPNHEALQSNESDFKSPWEIPYQAAYVLKSWTNLYDMYQILWYKHIAENTYEAVIKGNYIAHDATHPASLFKNPNTWEFLKNWDQVMIKQ